MARDYNKPYFLFPLPYEGKQCHMSQLKGTRRAFLLQYPQTKLYRTKEETHPTKSQRGKS